MSRLNYKECKKILLDINNNTHDSQYIDELLKLNNCNLEQFTEGLARQAFYIKGIRSIQHANCLKSDIQKKKLTPYEAELILSINDVDCLDEAYFELGKIEQRKATIAKYKAQFEAVQLELMQNTQISPHEIDFAQMTHNKNKLSALQVELRQELDAELGKIDATYFKG